MPRRQRWIPVKGTANRIYHPWERLALGCADLPGRAFAALVPQAAPVIDAATIREVLVLRLDRIGDLVMSLPALAALRRALPQARIRLAVGRWSEELARRAPVDEVLVWSAPWVGRASEGAEGLLGLAARARALRAERIDLGIDLQGDVRASLLLWLTGARLRAGYANTGGAYLLTHVVDLDETVSWVEQNRRAVSRALGRELAIEPLDPLAPAEREQAQRRLAASRRPLVGIHPSGGRPVKQWDVARFAEVGRRLQRELGATIVVTGSRADAELARALAAGLSEPPLDLTGQLSVVETMALVAALDLFLSPDTGPMHLACAVGTPSVSIFGPSDPLRYFSGVGDRHVVVRRELWCSPCNLIRKPPAECSGPAMPECLQAVTVDEVFAAAERLLRLRSRLSTLDSRLP